MKVKISKIKRTCGQYQADCLDLPGSPPIGIGWSEAEAVAGLFNLLIGDKQTRWTDMIPTDTFEVVRE